MIIKKGMLVVAINSNERASITENKIYLVDSVNYERVKLVCNDIGKSVYVTSNIDVISVTSKTLNDQLLTPANTYICTVQPRTGKFTVGKPYKSVGRSRNIFDDDGQLIHLGTNTGYFKYTNTPINKFLFERFLICHFFLCYSCYSF